MGRRRPSFVDKVAWATAVRCGELHGRLRHAVDEKGDGAGRRGGLRDGDGRGQRDHLADDRRIRRTVSCVVVSIFGLITTTPFCFLA